jgi:hypothetical protein
MKVEYYLAWLHARLDIARGAPPDTLLLIIAATAFILLLAIAAWIGARRRTHHVAKQHAALAADLVTSRKALDAERKWRLAAERTVSLSAKPAVEIEPAPLSEPRDLATVAKVRVEREYIEAVRGPDQPQLAPPASRRLAADAFRMDDQKAKRARAKSPRRAATVDDLINRTIVE